MKIRNRPELLQALGKSFAYNGKADLTEIQAFIAEQGIEIVDAAGNPINIKSVWDTPARLTQTKSDEVEEVPVIKSKSDATTKEADEEDDEDKEDEESKDKKNAALRINAKAGRFGENRGPAIRTDSARKSYQIKANKGETKFKSADDMEVFNAAYRLHTADICPGVKSFYPAEQQANDRAICGKTAHTELVNIYGGALVADDFRREMIYATESYGIYRYLANNVDMSGGDTIFPRKTGIFAMTHTAQGGSLTEVNNTYDQVRLVPAQIGCIVKTNRQLFSSAAVSVGDDIASSALEAYHKKGDQDYFLGDGTSTYGGHIGLANALPSAAYITAAVWASVTKTHLTQAIGSVENVDGNRLAWVMSRQAYAQIVTNLAVGIGGAQPEALTEAPFNGQWPNMGRLLGFPVYFSQVLPTASASTSKFAYFGDFVGGSMFGTRAKLEITPSTEAGFIYNQIWTRAVAEIAVNVHGDGKASTYGPIVCLKTS